MNIDNLDLSSELREKAIACKTPEEMLALAKAEGYKLSEEELAAVSGGAAWGRREVGARGKPVCLVALRTSV